GTAGVAWYRSTVTLKLLANQDTPLALSIADSASRHYSALLFVNGWQVGRYVNDVGPQHLFPIPPGIVNPSGTNTIAIAVWSKDVLAAGGVPTRGGGARGEPRTPCAGSSVTLARRHGLEVPTPAVNAAGSGWGRGVGQPASWSRRRLR